MKTNQFTENPWVRTSGISLLLGALLGLGGAFGTDEFPIITRTLFWVFSIFLGSLIAHTTNAILDKITALDERPIVYHLIGLVIMCPIIDVIVVGLIAIVFGGVFNQHSLLDYFPIVFIISIFMTIVHLVVSQIPRNRMARNLVKMLYLKSYFMSDCHSNSKRRKSSRLMLKIIICVSIPMSAKP